MRDLPLTLLHTSFPLPATTSTISSQSSLSVGMLPCAQCRKAKRRCVTVSGQLACLLCVQRQRICSRLAIPQPSLAGGKDAVKGQLPSPAPTSWSISEAADIVSQEIAVELVELYIRYMHDKPHALFHEPTLRESVVDGSIKKVVLFSLLGLGARYVYT